MIINLKGINDVTFQIFYFIKFWNLKSSTKSYSKLNYFFIMVVDIFRRKRSSCMLTVYELFMSGYFQSTEIILSETV